MEHGCCRSEDEMLLAFLVRLPCCQSLTPMSYDGHESLDGIDILLNRSTTSRFLSSSRWGRVQQVLHTFAYLFGRREARMLHKLVFDDELPNFQDLLSIRRMQFDIVQTRCGVSLSNTRFPEALDKPLTMLCFVDMQTQPCRLWCVKRLPRTGVL